LNFALIAQLSREHFPQEYLFSILCIVPFDYLQMLRLRGAQTFSKLLSSQSHLKSLTTAQIALFSNAPWYNNLLKNAPKGFEKFFRNPNSNKNSNSTQGKESASSSSNKPGEKDTKQNQSKPNDKKPSGDGKPKKPDFDFNDFKVAAIFAALFATAMVLMDEKSGREISWQDFQKQLLETGQVDRIVVTNKNIAR
jgi:hypothetical protein